MRAEAADYLGVLALRSQANKDAIRGENGIKPLIALLRDADARTRENAALAITNLAIKNYANNEAIREAQGISSLIALLSDKNAQVRNGAARALVNLSSDNEANKNAIRQAEGIKPLVELLNDFFSDTKLIACLALCNLSYQNNANKNAIREAQGISPVLSLLLDANNEIRSIAARTLANLATSNPGNQDAIREAGAITRILALFTDRSLFDIRKYAILTLGHLASNNTSNQNAIRESQGIPALIKVLESRRDYGVSAEIKEYAAWALSTLASNNKTNQDAIRNANGIAPLVRLFDLSYLAFWLKDMYANIKQQTAETLWVLASNNPSNQAAIIDCGALPRLAKLAPANENAQKILDVCQALQTSRKQEIKVDSAKKTITTPTKTISLGEANSSSKSFKSTPSTLRLTEAKLTSPKLTYTPTIAASALVIDYSKRLGEGGFGVVYQGQWQRVTVAAKKLKATNLSPQALASFQEEGQRHGLLRHPNIVMLFGVCVEPGHYSMVMEFMSGGSLYGFLHSSQDIPWSLRKSIAENISSGLYYLHDHQIIHRDLKSLNVLLDDRGQAKLADFGLAALKSETQSTTTTAAKPTGTVRWMAPELFKRGGKCTESSDIYALGWVLWEIAARKIPFEDEQQANDAVIMDWIKEGERDSIPADTPPQYAALLSRCWQQRAEDRPANIKQITDDLSALTIREPANLASGYRYFSSL